MDDVARRVRGVIIEAFELDRSDLPALFDADVIANWDSLGHLTLMSRLEKEFGIEIPFSVAVELLSEEAVVSAVQRLGSP